MPDWNHNVLLLKTKPEIFDKIIKEVHSDTSDFDFNKILPQPKGLFLENTPAIPVEGLAYLQKNDQDKYQEVIQAAIKFNKFEKFLEWRPASLPAIVADNEKSARKPTDTESKMIESFIATGCFSWFDWNVQNWGTKWSAQEANINPKSQAIEFDTPWCAPTKLLQAFANKYQISFGVKSTNESGFFEYFELEPESIVK